MAAMMNLWETWFGSLGEAIVDGGNPIAFAKTVASDGSVADGGGLSPLTGYSLINADNIDAAVEMAKGCPVLANNGSVEVPKPSTCESIRLSRRFLRTDHVRRARRRESLPSR